MSYSSNYKLLLNPSSENPNRIDSYAAITKYDTIISEHVKKSKSNSNLPFDDVNVSPGSVKTPISANASPYYSDDFFEAAQDVKRKEEITAEEEQKEKEEKEKELLLSDIIEELPGTYTSPRYPENVSPAFNPNAENILEFKEEEKEEFKEEEKEENESGTTKKIIISSSSEPSSSSSESSSSSSEPSSSSSESSSSSSSSSESSKLSE
jgi:hypothetical protein